MPRLRMIPLLGFNFKGEARQPRARVLDAPQIYFYDPQRNGTGILIGKNAFDITVGGGTDIGGTLSGHWIFITDEGSGFGPANIIINGVHSYNNALAAIAVDKAKHVVIQGCILSGHKHRAVKNPGQQYGMLIKPGTEDISLTGNIIFGNVLNDVQ